MSDLETYIEGRKHRDHELEEGFEQAYREFKIGVLLKQAREQAGLSQEERARKMGTKKTAISE